jgi:RNA-directed DNA polymerase
VGKDHAVSHEAASVREAAARARSPTIPAQERSIAAGGATFERVTDPAVLRRAARQGMGRLGGPGLDGITWRQYRIGFRARIEELSGRLQDQSWRPSPVRNATLSFPDKNLEIVVPTVEDRIVQRAVRNILEPMIVARCEPFVFGWVPRRPWGAAAAMARDYLVNAPWVVDADVYRATAGGDIDELIGWLREYTMDGRLLRLVALILSGLPRPLAPGTGLTPMLTNLRLMPVDLAVCQLRVVRFTDNYCIFTSSALDAHRARLTLAAALAEWRLNINATKSCVRWNPDSAELFGSGCAAS